MTTYYSIETDGGAIISERHDLRWQAMDRAQEIADERGETVHVVKMSIEEGADDPVSEWKVTPSAGRVV